MKISLGFWGILIILIVLVSIIWIWGISMILGVAFVMIPLIYAGPKQIENYRKIWFWLFVIGLFLVVTSGMGYGFQIEQSTIVWKGLPPL